MRSKHFGWGFVHFSLFDPADIGTRERKKRFFSLSQFHTAKKAQKPTETLARQAAVVGTSHLQRVSGQRSKSHGSSCSCRFIVIIIFFF